MKGPKLSATGAFIFETKHVDRFNNGDEIGDRMYIGGAGVKIQLMDSKPFEGPPIPVPGFPAIKVVPLLGFDGLTLTISAGGTLDDSKAPGTDLGITGKVSLESQVSIKARVSDTLEILNVTAGGGVTIFGEAALTATPGNLVFEGEAGVKDPVITLRVDLRNPLTDEMTEVLDTEYRFNYDMPSVPLNAQIWPPAS